MDKAKKRKSIKRDNPAQSDRVTATAKKLGSDSGGAFDRAIKAFFPPNPKSKSKPKR